MLAIDAARVVWAVLQSNGIVDAEAGEIQRRDDCLDENDAPDEISDGNLIADMLAFVRVLVEEAVGRIGLLRRFQRSSAGGK